MKARSVSTTIRIITHNVRYATTSPFKGEKLWVDRKQLVINELLWLTQHNNEAFVCLQEALWHQLLDVLEGLNAHQHETEQWEYIGVGRDDGVRDGEFSPILYRPAAWMLASAKTVWLSETPDVPSFGWDAGCRRILTVGRFGHKETGREVVGMCTHLDNSGATSRAESAKLILKTISDVTAPPSVQLHSTSEERLPVFLAGDLNSDTNDAAYQILNSVHSQIQNTEDMADLSYGNEYTYTGFDEKEKKEVIDHVFVGPRGEDGTGNGMYRVRNWKVKSRAVLPNRFDDGVFGSDHRAVVADVILL